VVPTLGIMPLLWGTLLCVPHCASGGRPDRPDDRRSIWPSIAGSALRSFAKPAIEILAGIPTIVYGLFALITVGPLLRTGFRRTARHRHVLVLGDDRRPRDGHHADPLRVVALDDIINAVPQAMRDGSYGLGATQSETIKQVILPAALPGIVGAILLAASRAIGETMIVVLGAGAAARLSLNPFEAMTTVTVKIVSQLTGDTDFASPRGAGGLRAGPDALRHDAGSTSSPSTSCANTGSSTNDRCGPCRNRATRFSSVGERTRRKRNAAEKRFRMMGLAAVIIRHRRACRSHWGRSSSNGAVVLQTRPTSRWMSILIPQSWTRMAIAIAGGSAEDHDLYHPASDQDRCAGHA
jgi:hypothetical protein